MNDPNADASNRLSGLRRLLGKMRSPRVPPDMTSSQVNKTIFMLVWPSALELFLSTLSSMVDMMMVGRLGTWAVAAVGLTTQPKFVLLALFIALNSGATALVARLRGEDNQKDANTTMRQALLITGVLCVVISIIGYLASPWLVNFMGSQSDTHDPAVGYLQVQMIGFPFMALTMVVTAVLRGVGNTRVSLIYNMVANVSNVLLNFVFIYGYLGFPAMGVIGSSWATIIGQFIALIMAMLALFSKKHYLSLRAGDSFMPDFAIIKRIVRIGLPAMLEQAIMRTGLLLYVRTVSSLGTIAYATHNIASNILNLSFMNGQAFGIAATALIGQSLGKQRLDQAKLYVSRSRQMGMIVSLFIALFLILFGKQILSLYISAGDPAKPDVLRLGYQVLLVIAFMQPLQSSQLILSGALRGAGDTLSTAIIMFVGIMVIRPIASYFFVNVIEWGLIGAWLAMGTDQVVRSTLSYIRFQTGKWMYIRV